MNDDDLFRRREECLRYGIPRSAYIEAIARAQELRRQVLAGAIRSLLRAVGYRRVGRAIQKETTS